MGAPNLEEKAAHYAKEHVSVDPSTGEVDVTFNLLRVLDAVAASGATGLKSDLVAAVRLALSNKPFDHLLRKLL